MAKKFSDGFKCRCGRYEKFGAYVAAHWSERLVFTCPDCDSKYVIQDGKAILEAKGKDKPKGA